MAKQGKSKQKKMNVRVDFTPMVDMMMLLITFFMLCTSLAKPQTMELSMPSNDKNLTDQDKTVTKESYTLTFYCTADNQLYYVAGQVKPENPKCLVKTTWGAKGIRSVIFNHQTEDGTQPAKTVMEAKAKLDKEKDNGRKGNRPQNHCNQSHPPAIFKWMLQFNRSNHFYTFREVRSCSLLSAPVLQL